MWDHSEFEGLKEKEILMILKNLAFQSVPKFQEKRKKN